MSFWVGYLLGVSQNVVAAILFGPWIIARMKHHLNRHHREITDELARHSARLRRRIRDDMRDSGSWNDPGQTSPGSDSANDVQSGQEKGPGEGTA